MSWLTSCSPRRDMAVHEMLTVGGGVLWVGEVTDQRRSDRSAAWCLRINRRWVFAADFRSGHRLGQVTPLQSRRLARTGPVLLEMRRSKESLDRLRGLLALLLPVQCLYPGERTQWKGSQQNSMNSLEGFGVAWLQRNVKQRRDACSAAWAGSPPGWRASGLACPSAAVGGASPNGRCVG